MSLAPGRQPRETADAAPPHPRGRRWTTRRAVRTGVVAAGVLAVLYVVICVVAASILTRGTHRPLGAVKADVGPHVEDVAFPSRGDHLQLRGWLAASGAGSGRAVILVHGRDSNRAAMDFGAIPLAHDLLAHGYDVLLFDLRSSGESEGSRFTLGNEEPRDLLGAYDFMLGRKYVPARLGVIGWSEGAATVLEAAPQLDGVGALVADSAYADLGPILDAQIPKNDPLPRMFDWGSVTAARLLFDFDPSLRPVDTVRALPDRAFLFVEGTADDIVPASNGQQLRQASANSESRLLVVPGAGHVQEFKTDPSSYLGALYPFLDQQIVEHGGGTA